MFLKENVLEKNSRKRNFSEKYLLEITEKNPQGQVMPPCLNCLEFSAQ